MTSYPTASAALELAMVDVARLRLGLPGAEPAEVRAFYPDEFEGLWSVPLFDGERGRVIVLMAEGEDVAAHAGLPRAAARLEPLRLFGRPEGLLKMCVRPLLDAVGGLTPGYPRYAEEIVEASEEGVRLVLDVPEVWARYAAAGAEGPPPSERMGSSSSSGIAPPETRGRMVCEVMRSGSLSWTYEAAGESIGTFSGDPSEDRPDMTSTVNAETALAEGRSLLASPLAVASEPVVFSGADGLGRLRVSFLGLEAVVVNQPEGA